MWDVQHPSLVWQVWELTLLPTHLTNPHGMYYYSIPRRDAHHTFVSCGLLAIIPSGKSYDIVPQCLQAYGFIRISYGIGRENTEYGESDLEYGY